ncbi:hypothetical protein GE09DRAFT_738459 [Coniochaeta sp. 2T2.1]|nr:hypothetical protein GE09DRAFT_738459 [Coniochaeta sp. 2T2.1]
MKTSSILTTILVIVSCAIAADWGCKTELCRPGDACDSFATKHGITLDQLVAFNPQLFSLKDCPANIVAWNVYCVVAQRRHEPALYPSAKQAFVPTGSNPARIPTSIPTSKQAINPTSIGTTSHNPSTSLRSSRSRPDTDNSLHHIHPQRQTLNQDRHPGPLNGDDDDVRAPSLSPNPHLRHQPLLARIRIRYRQGRLLAECVVLLGPKREAAHHRGEVEHVPVPRNPELRLYQCQWISEPAAVVVRLVLQVLHERADERRAADWVITVRSGPG